MQTEKELNEAILEITLKIEKEYPELTKYISELAVTIPDKSSPEITIKHLKNYYESLNSLLRKYTINHKKAEAVKLAENGE